MAERNRRTPACPACVAALFLSGCAAQPSPGQPLAADDPARNPSRLCEPGRTFSCVERVGKPVRCVCADKDALREVFDPMSTVR